MSDEISLVLRHGTVVDGTGAPPRLADVAVAGDRIVAVGTVAARGAEEIDARGMLVTPGFVDLHTHYDGQAVWDARLAPSSWHGVTTVLAGNCGVGFAPVRVGDRDRLVELMEGVEDIPAPALHEGLDWNWESFGDFLDVLERRPRDVDLCTQLPHAALRVYVMGERASTLEPAREDDIAAMRAIASEAMRAGALGFSTSRTLNHRTVKGDPTPSLRASEAELTGIALGLRDAGHGILELISDFRSEEAEAEFAMIRRVVAASGRPLVFSLGQSHRDGNAWRQLLAWSEQAVAAGLPIRPVVAPRPIAVLLGLQGSQNPFSGTPSYRAIADQPLPERVAALRDPALRRRILSEDPFAESNFPLMRLLGYERMFPFGDPPDYEPPREASIAAIAAREGRPAAEVAYDALLADEGRSFLFAPIANYADYNLDTCGEMLGRDVTLVGLGDGGAHVGFISDASFPTYLLAHWGRDRARGRLDLPALIRRQTSDTARAIGLHDRGVVAPGMKADLNVIDYDALSLERPYMVHDLPAGGRRLLQRARGYRATVVSGVVTYRDGEPTGALPGRVVRGPQAQQRA